MSKLELESWMPLFENVKGLFKMVEVNLQSIEDLCVNTRIHSDFFHVLLMSNLELEFWTTLFENGDG